MRCKPGDMAVVIDGDEPYIGYILKVIELSPSLGDAWRTEPEVRNPCDNSIIVCFCDDTLLPIKGLPELEGVETDNPIKETV